jgi:hypothetical protein
LEVETAFEVQKVQTFAGFMHTALLWLEEEVTGWRNRERERVDDDMKTTTTTMMTTT